MNVQNAERDGYRQLQRQMKEKKEEDVKLKEKLLLQGDVTSPLKSWKKHGHNPFEWMALQNT